MKPATCPKTGIGAGAQSLLFFPMWLLRSRHWLVNYRSVGPC